jgi:hypothetical protein
MFDAVRSLHALGASLEPALAAASTVPARVLGANATVAPGACAEAVDDSLGPRGVDLGGEPRVTR